MSLLLILFVWLFLLPLVAILFGLSRESSLFFLALFHLRILFALLCLYGPGALEFTRVVVAPVSQIITIRILTELKHYHSLSSSLFLFFPLLLGSGPGGADALLNRGKNSVCPYVHKSVHPPPRSLWP